MRDEQGLVGRAAVTIMILTVLGGLAAIDAGSILFTSLRLSDVGDVAASAGAQTFDSTHDFSQAKQAAINAAHEEDPDAKVQRFTVSPRGVVSVTVRKVASTLVVSRVGFLKHFGVVHVTSTGSP